MLLILVGQISLSALITLFFAYGAELLPTILRYGPVGAGHAGERAGRCQDEQQRLSLGIHPGQGAYMDCSIKPSQKQLPNTVLSLRKTTESKR